MKLSTYTFLSTFGELAVSYQALTSLSMAVAVFAMGSLFVTGKNAYVSTPATVVGVSDTGIDVMYSGRKTNATQHHIGVFIPRDASIYSVGMKTTVMVDWSTGYVFEGRSMLGIGIGMVVLGILMSLVASVVLKLVTDDTDLAAMSGLYAFLGLVF